MTTPARLYALDFLRFAAAIGVVLRHWGLMVDPSVRAMTFYPLLWERYGHLGVELFFMISGFVILMTAQGATLRSFIVARIVRLYPGFWICCSVSMLFMLAAPSSPGFGDYLANMTMLPGIAHVPYINNTYWTLALEFQFYLLIAILILIGRLDRIEKVLWVWVFLSAITFSSNIRTLIAADYAGCFAGGCACFLLRQRPTRSRWALVFAAWLLTLQTTIERGSTIKNFDQAAFDPFILAGLVTVFFALMIAIAKDWWVMPKSRWVMLAGAMSYPLYLLHLRIGYQLFDMGSTHLPGLLLYLVMLAWIVALSWAVYAFAEMPLQRWLRVRLEGVPDRESSRQSPPAESALTVTQPKVSTDMAR